MKACRKTDEATFAKQLAHELYRRVNSENSRGPRADCRSTDPNPPILHKEVQKRIVSEIGKTLTKASITDNEEALSSDEPVIRPRLFNPPTNEICVSASRPVLRSPILE